MSERDVMTFRFNNMAAGSVGESESYGFGIDGLDLPDLPIYLNRQLLQREYNLHQVGQESDSESPDEEEDYDLNAPPLES